MKSPVTGPIAKARQIGDRVRVPVAERLALTDFLYKTYRRAEENHIRVFAAGLTYRGLFAGFSFLVFLLSLLGVFHATDLVVRLFNRVSLAMPAAVSTFIRDEVLKLTQNRVGAVFTVGAIVAVAGALWGLSSGFRDIMEIMNVIYRVEEGRSFKKRLLITVLLSLGVVALQVAALILVIFGARLGGVVARAVGLGPVFRWTWNILQWPILVSFVLLAFALVYYYGPDVEQKFRFISPGSVIGLILWLVFSLLFLLFVNSFGVYNKIYGALAGLVIHMLYTYYSSFILLLGAQMNQVLEEHTEGGKKAGEKMLPEDGSSDN